MNGPDLSAFRVLIVPGLHGSNEAHWQSRWERLHPSFERVVQADWDIPDLAAWAQRVRVALEADSRPTLIVAHSFGCLASIHASGNGNLVGALLVAPADPVKFGVASLLEQRRLECPAIVVGSIDDPWMEQQRASHWALRWGCDFINAGALGHINAESWLGDWPFGLQLLH
ncbi:MAG TPA: alpha/beta hydrolase, partial [Noviherbaspirillum sp.]